MLVSLCLAWWPPYWERAVQLAVHLRCVGWFEISLVATLLGKICLTVHLRCVGWFEISLIVVQVAVHLCCVG